MHAVGVQEAHHGVPLLKGAGDLPHLRILDALVAVVPHTAVQPVLHKGAEAGLVPLHVAEIQQDIAHVGADHLHPLFRALHAVELAAQGARGTHDPLGLILARQSGGHGAAHGVGADQDVVLVHVVPVQHVLIEGVGDRGQHRHAGEGLRAVFRVARAVQVHGQHHKPPAGKLHGPGFMVASVARVAVTVEDQRGGRLAGGVFGDVQQRADPVPVVPGQGQPLHLYVAPSGDDPPVQERHQHRQDQRDAEKRLDPLFPFFRPASL